MLMMLLRFSLMPRLFRRRADADDAIRHAIRYAMMPLLFDDADIDITPCYY